MTCLYGHIMTQKEETKQCYGGLWPYGLRTAMAYGQPMTKENKMAVDWGQKTKKK